MLEFFYVYNKICEVCDSVPRALNIRFDQRVKFRVFGQTVATRDIRYSDVAMRSDSHRTLKGPDVNAKATTLQSTHWASTSIVTTRKKLLKIGFFVRGIERHIEYYTDVGDFQVSTSITLVPTSTFHRAIQCLPLNRGYSMINSTPSEGWNADQIRALCSADFAFKDTVYISGHQKHYRPIANRLN